MNNELKVIKKVSKVHSMNGVIVDSLDSNSPANAPSIHAVNEGLNNKSTIKKDDVIQQELVLSTQRTSNPTVINVQLKDIEGNVLYVEGTLENSVIKAKDGSEEVNAKELFTDLFDLAKLGLYTSQVKSKFDNIAKFI